MKEVEEGGDQVDDCKIEICISSVSALVFTYIDLGGLTVNLKWWQKFVGL